MNSVLGTSSSLNLMSESDICTYLDGLMQIDELNRAAVEAWLLDERDEVHGCAARAVGRAQHGSPAAVAGLKKLLTGDSVVGRQSAAAALGEIGAPARDAVQELVKALFDEDENVREFAALALKDMGAAAEPAVKGLTDALRDGNAWVRGAAAWALGEIGRPAVVAASPLQDLLDDSVLWVRCRAATALSAAGVAAEDNEKLAASTHHHCDHFEACVSNSLNHLDAPSGCPLREKTT